MKITIARLKEIIKEESALERAARTIADNKRARAEAEARARAGDRAAAPRPYNADEDIHGWGPDPHLTSKQKPKTPEQIEAMLRSQAARLGVDPEVYMANFKKMSPPAQQQSLESGFELTHLDDALGTGPEGASHAFELTELPPGSQSADWDEEQERFYGAQSPEVQAYKNFGQPDLDTRGIRESKKLTKSSLRKLIKEEINLLERPMAMPPEVFDTFRAHLDNVNEAFNKEWGALRDQTAAGQVDPKTAAGGLLKIWKKFAEQPWYKIYNKAVAAGQVQKHEAHSKFMVEATSLLSKNLVTVCAEAAELGTKRSKGQRHIDRLLEDAVGVMLGDSY